MKNADMPAMPVETGQLHEVASGCDADGHTRSSMGLTKREWFAGMALQGILAARQKEHAVYDTEVDDLAYESVDYAEAILCALKETE